VSPYLLDGVRDCIRVKYDSLRTERADLDWIRRFIHFHGKHHPPGVETYLTRLDGMRDCSPVIDEQRPMPAMKRNALPPETADGSRTTDYHLPTASRQSVQSKADAGISGGARMLFFEPHHGCASIT
jgi:hypothetical protein